MNSRFAFLFIALTAFPFNSFGGFLDQLNQIQNQVEKAKGVLEKAKGSIGALKDNHKVNGTVIINDDSKPWYFKMLYFNASGCTRLYYQVNDGEPKFLGEFVGPLRKLAFAPIEIKGLKRGDRVRFIEKTYWNGSWYGPIGSDNGNFFKVKGGNGVYRFSFEDAAGFDMAYNDGEFLFYRGDKGPLPNRCLQIESFKALKSKSGILFSGKLKLSCSGNVGAQIEIKDNRWQTYKVIDLSFKNASSQEKAFKYEFNYPLPAPMYTAIFTASLNGETDQRIRGLKGCITKFSNFQGVFGSSQVKPFSFTGNVYFLPKGTSSLPDFKTLTPVGKIYTYELNIPPRSFKEGFPGITDRYEWFAIDYKGKAYFPKGRDYTFCLLSDDGAKLFIDGNLIINNDGIHPPTEKCGTVKLTEGFHNLEVQYFQGPRYEIALVLSLVRSGHKEPFNIQNFLPVKVSESKCRVNLRVGSKLLFEFNSYSLKPNAYSVLDQVVEYLKGMSYKKIIVSGHTDNVGSKKYNYQLSLKRASAVANYLISKGIPKEKVEIVGYGESRPLYPNNTEENRAKNRRVEIEVLKECEGEGTP